MPQNKKAARMGTDDRISGLPDDVAHHVLSFLQAEEAVRSCVLAKRWHHLWKSMPVLRVTSGRPAHLSHRLMDHLIVLRGHSPVDACLFNFGEVSEDDEHYVNLWIRYALLCKVRVLNVAVRDDSYFLTLSRLPGVSQNLTSLELANVRLDREFLELSSCPSLEELKMSKCLIPVGRVSSHSLKRLSIQKCRFQGLNGNRTRISVPSLTSLQLTDVRGTTPFLEDMPTLVTATVTFDLDCWDSHRNIGSVDCDVTSWKCCYGVNGDGAGSFCNDASCECCYGIDDGAAGCLLLKGLSAATDLKLIAEPGLIILQRDLRWCRTFSKLKRLSLNEWSVAGDHRALICILQHAPVLEKLILQLFQTAEDTEHVKAAYNLLEQSFASEKLKIVEIACEEVNASVHNIMRSLCTYGIPLENITIRQTNESSGCFNFVCTGFSSKPGEEDQGR